MNGVQVAQATAAGGGVTVGGGLVTRFWWNDMGSWLASADPNLPLPIMSTEVAAVHAVLLLGLVIYLTGFLPRNRNGDAGPLPGPNA